MLFRSRHRSQKFVQDGTSLFEFVFPLKMSKIQRILRVAPSESDILERTRSELLKLIYENPRISAEEMKETVEKIAETIPEDRKKVVKRKKKYKRKKSET